MNQSKRGFKLAPVLPVTTHNKQRPPSPNTFTNDSEFLPSETTETGLTTTPRTSKTTVAITLTHPIHGDL